LPAATPTQRIAVEAKARADARQEEDSWARAMTTAGARAYQDFLDRFPNSTHAEDARRKIAEDRQERA
jgi:outer membrane protein assembly factor BamD (BamD/ComL family)